MQKSEEVEKKTAESVEEAGDGSEDEDHSRKRKRPAVACEECGSGDAKYKCPRCLRKTCSLKCVNLHKERENCSGKRNKAEYHSLTDFTDEHFHSDFHYLQDVERVADTAHRQAFRSKLYLKTNLPNHLKNLVRQARFRNVNLVIMPATFQRRRANTTMFSHRDKEMLWRVEFVFHADGDRSFVQDKVSEKTLLSELLAKYVDPTLGAQNAKERQQVPETVKAGLHKCKLLLRQEPSKADDVRYYAVSPTDTLAMALRNKTIIESPIFHLYGEAEGRKLRVVPTPDSVPSSAPREMAAFAGTDESAVATLPYARREREEGDAARGRGRGGFRGRGRGGHRGGRAGDGKARGGEAEEEGEVKAEEEGPVIEPEAVAEEEVAAVMALVGQDLSNLGAVPK